MGTNLHSQWQRILSDPTNRGTLNGSSVHRVLDQGCSYPIRGVIWYQGESDVGRGTALYLQDLRDLVADYRADLGDPTLFFGSCQLATNQGAELVTGSPSRRPSASRRRPTRSRPSWLTAVGPRWRSTRSRSRRDQGSAGTHGVSRRIALARSVLPSSVVASTCTPITSLSTGSGTLRTTAA